MKPEGRRQEAEVKKQNSERAVSPAKLVAAIRSEFEKAADPKYRESIQRFFKEEIDVYGVRTADARRIYQECFNKVKHLPKQEIFEICELLHQGTKYEEHGIAFSWAGKLSAQFEPGDFRILEEWLKKYVSNWAACDTFCGGAVGEFLVKFPEFLPKVRGWAKSKNRWLRRASAVALIPALKTEPEIHHKDTKARRGEGRSEKLEAGAQNPFVSQAYKTVDILLLDEDDMVQKGYGWLLKEIANKHPDEVLDFVLKRKAQMPRTALRYAIEKMPAAWKRRAMAR